MNYDKQILMLLTEAGLDGLCVTQISKKIYNENCSFFEKVNFDDVHKYVLSFLHKNMYSRNSFIESTGKRGFYRINTQSYDSDQLMFNFVDEEYAETEEDEIVIDDDQSLSLF